MKPDKAWFERDMAHTDLKDLPIRTTSKKVFRDKAFNELIIFFVKASLSGAIKSKTISN